MGIGVHARPWVCKHGNKESGSERATKLYFSQSAAAGGAGRIPANHRTEGWGWTGYGGVLVTVVSLAVDGSEFVGGAFEQIIKGSVCLFGCLIQMPPFSRNDDYTF